MAVVDGKNIDTAYVHVSLTKVRRGKETIFKTLFILTIYQLLVLFIFSF